LALIAGCSLYAGLASATTTTYRLQPAAGQPHLNGLATWSNEWIQSGWKINDGRAMQFPTGGVWDTAIPLTTDNANWSVAAFGNGGSGETCWTNRICTFDSNGVFFSCGGNVTNFLSSTAFVPLQGSAYSQSFSNCNSGTLPTVAQINHIIANN